MKSLQKSVHAGRVRVAALVLSSASSALFACHAYDEGLIVPLNIHKSVSPENGGHGGNGNDVETNVDSATDGDPNHGGNGDTSPLDNTDVIPDAGARDAARASNDASTPPGEVTTGTEDPETKPTIDDTTHFAGAGGAGSSGNAGNGGTGAVSEEDAGTPGVEVPIACSEANALRWAENGHCYFPLTVTDTWFVGRDLCNKLGAHLVTITSASEQAFVSTLVGSTPRWIGLARFGAPTFSWLNGESVTYENWEPGAPNVKSEAGAVIRNGTFLWFDETTKGSRAALCERE